ncbi:replication protein (plasmid) [Mesorhizobium loti]|uniref:replication initiator protein A n=1 Tax=Mesorhizobium sp. 131-2-5 TaxID=2744519 RepID=UPI0008199D3C|nr:replication initiator protein A [Mesorhizobium sp. 131-2-5]BAV53036.1 replication protein [Mesorhizobium loti]
MKTPTIAFMSRKDFAELSLYQKNDYLQDITKQVLELRGDAYIPLTRDALSRLRRFYSRRSFADLRLEEMADDAMRDVLAKLGENIVGKELAKLIDSEIPPSAHAARIKRPPPIDDDQLMFFVPTVHDAPLKDEVNLMDVAPFSLSKMKRDGIIRYELKDCVITVEGGAEVGIANAYDYDIFLNMVSYLAEEMRRYRAAEKDNRRTSLPSQVYRPTAAQILKFCRRERGGKQYDELEKALDRLQATRIKIVNVGKGSRRDAESFPLIGRYKVVSRTAQDRIEQVEMEIPGWVYEGVVRPDGKPSILTLNPDYFLIAKPIAKFIYRLARKAAGQTEAFYRVEDLHYRSGSQLPLRKFRQTVTEIVNDAKSDPLPDYDISLRDGRDGPILYMKKRQDGDAPAQSEMILDNSAVHHSA